MEKTSSAEKVAGALALTAGAVAAVATGYYFYGKSGAKHRQEAETWSKQAKLEMLKKIKQMKVVTQAAYDKAAAEVLAKYKQAKNIKPEELYNFGQELKAHWAEISKQAAKLGNQAPAKKLKTKI